MKLIDKDTLLAEIERLYDEKGTFYAADVLYNLKEWLDTLEVKEVDLEKEIDKFYGMYRDENGVTYDGQDNEICLDWKEGCNELFKIEFAKHFFELGLKVKQG